MSDLQLSQDEISTARDPRWRVVGVAGTHSDSLAVLKFAFGNGETDVVSLHGAAVESLISVLKTIVPNFDAAETTGVVVNLDTGQTTASNSE